MNRWRGLHPQSAGRRGQTEESLVDANGAYLLPGLDLGIGVNIGSMELCPSLRVDGGTLRYQK